VQVNVITKSGTNQMSGLFRTNFRSGRFNAPDPLAHKVVPIRKPSVQHGCRRPDPEGPAALLRQFRVRKRTQSERVDDAVPEVSTSSLPGKASKKLAGVRVDYQRPPRTRLMGKVSGQRSYTPFGAGFDRSSCLDD
jgi:hypothetical protein